MTRDPFFDDETTEMDVVDGDVAAELESYASLAESDVPVGFSDRVMAAVNAEPTPRRGLFGLFGGSGGGLWGRSVLVAASLAVLVAGVLAASQLSNLLPDGTGTSPPPSQVESPTSPIPTDTPSPSVTEMPSPSASPSATDAPSASPRPTRTPDESPEESESPEPSETPEASETPEPSESDNSGPGGGHDGDGGQLGEEFIDRDDPAGEPIGILALAHRRRP